MKFTDDAIFLLFLCLLPISCATCHGFNKWHDVEIERIKHDCTTENGDDDG